MHFIYWLLQRDHRLAPTNAMHSVRATVILCLAITSCLITSIDVVGQGVPKCWCNYGPDSIPDFSVDTCGLMSPYTNCWEILEWHFFAGEREIQAQHRMYSSGAYSIAFEVDAFSPPSGPDDSLVTLQDADSKYPEIRDGLLALETTFEKFTLTRRYREDTLQPFRRVFDCRFQSSVNIDTALSVMENIPYSTSAFDNYPAILTSVRQGHTSSQLGNVQVIVRNQQLVIHAIACQGLNRAIIYDVLGHAIQSIEIPSRIVRDTNTTTIIDIPGLPAGSYFLLMCQTVVPFQITP